MKKVLFIILLLCASQVSVLAQEQRDSMEVSIAIRPTDKLVTIEVLVKPWGNPGLTYFELNNTQYGLRSFSGQEASSTYAFSIPNLNPNTSYVMKMFATNDKGQTINTRDYKFNTRPAPKTSASKKKR